GYSVVNRFGVLQIGLRQNILVNGDSYFHEARSLLKPPTDPAPAVVEEYNKLVLDTAVYLFLMRFNHELDQEKLKDMNLFFAFFEHQETDLNVSRVLAI